MSFPRRLLLATNSTSNPLLEPSPPQEGIGESDFIVLLAALVCAIICIFGLMAVARCTCLRREIPPSHPSANKGLKKKVLNSLPKYTFNSDNKPSAEAEDCAICLTEYGEGDEIRVLPQCGHGFHVQCIDTWLGSHSSCPSCRQVLVVNRCRKCGEVDSAVDGGGSSKITKLKLFSSGASTSSATYLP